MSRWRYDGSFRILDESTGATLHSAELVAAGANSVRLIHDDGVVYVVPDGRASDVTAHRIDPAQTLWSITGSDRGHVDPQVTTLGLVIGSRIPGEDPFGIGAVTNLDPGTGDELWRVQLARPPQSITWTSGGLFVTAGGEFLLCD